MTIKERAHNAVKTTYAKYGLKADELTKIADNIASGLNDETTDEELNAAVKGAEFYASLMQSVGNRKQTEIENKFKGWNPPAPKEPTPTPEPPAPKVEHTPKPEQPPMTKKDIAKMIQEGIAAGIAPLLQKQEHDRLTTLLNGSEKLKGIPQSFRSKYSLDKEEDLDAVADRISKDYQTLKQEMFKEGTIIEAPVQSTPQQEEDAAIEKLKRCTAIQAGTK